MQKYFRGTLGLSKDSPVGISDIQLRFEVDTDASDAQLATLLDAVAGGRDTVAALAGTPAAAAAPSR